MSCKCCGKEECCCAKDCSTKKECDPKCKKMSCLGKLVLAALLGVILTFTALIVKNQCCSSQCAVKKTDEARKSK